MPHDLGLFARCPSVCRTPYGRNTAQSHTGNFLTRLLFPCRRSLKQPPHRPLPQLCLILHVSSLPQGHIPTSCRASQGNTMVPSVTPVCHPGTWP